MHSRLVVACAALRSCAALRVSLVPTPLHCVIEHCLIRISSLRIASSAPRHFAILCMLLRLWLASQPRLELCHTTNLFPLVVCVYTAILPLLRAELPPQSNHSRHKHQSPVVVSLWSWFASDGRKREPNSYLLRVIELQPDSYRYCLRAIAASSKLLQRAVHML